MASALSTAKLTLQCASGSGLSSAIGSERSDGVDEALGRAHKRHLLPNTGTAPQGDRRIRAASTSNRTADLDEEERPRQAPVRPIWPSSRLPKFQLNHGTATHPSVPLGQQPHPPRPVVTAGEPHPIHSADGRRRRVRVERSCASAPPAHRFRCTSMGVRGTARPGVHAPAVTGDLTRAVFRARGRRENPPCCSGNLEVPPGEGCRPRWARR